MPPSDPDATGRVVGALRRLQDLARRKIDPDSTMTADEFVDEALAEIDDVRLNEALEVLELTLDEDDVD